MTIADFLWSNNLLMQSVVNDVELLVFSSKLLKPCLQGKISKSSLMCLIHFISLLFYDSCFHGIGVLKRQTKIKEYGSN